MTAVLLPEGKQSFETSAGIPLVGGKVFTYDAGTSNPRNTWSDAAQTSLNANPIILDARGEATIYWSGAYKVILQDALGNVIWTVDPVSDFISSLTQAVIGALIYPRDTPEQTAGVNPVNFINSYGNPRRQGAVGDGLTSDRAAFNTQNSTGEQIYVTRGSYLIDSNLTISSAITFEAGASLKVANGVTVTISGNVRAGRYPIFSLQGTGQVLFTQSSNAEVYPEWWYDGLGDWSVAINYALRSINTIQVVQQNGGYTTANNVGQAVLLGNAVYPTKKPILLTDKSRLRGCGYSSLITPIAGFLGSAAILNYVDFIGSIAGGVLTVTQITAGVITVGSLLSSGTFSPTSAGVTATVPANVTITALGSGTGGVGTYSISNAAINVASQNLQTLPPTTWGFWDGSIRLEEFQVWDKVGLANTMGISVLSLGWDSLLTNVTVAGFFRAGMKFDSCYGVDARGLFIYNCSQQGGAASLWLTATSTIDRMTSSQFSGCKVENAPVGVFGVAIEHCSVIRFQELTNEGNGFGISFLDSGECVVDSCYLEDIDREIVTFQYNGTNSNSQNKITNCGFARGTYVTPILLQGCVDTLIENCGNGTPSVAFVNANANALRWKLVNCGALSGIGTGGIGLGTGRGTLLRDDFVANALGANWATAGAGGAGAFQALVGGVFRLTTGNVSTNSFTLTSGPNNSLIPSASPSIEIRCRLNAVANVNWRPISLENGAQYIRVYVNNAGGDTGFVLEVSDGTVVTAATGLLGGTAWHVLKLDILQGVVTLSIDGAVKATVSTHVPTIALQFLTYIVTQAAVANSMDIDYIQIDMDRVVAP